MGEDGVGCDCDSNEQLPTHRELEVLWALKVHGTAGKAAKVLFLSRYTVQTHICNLRHKARLKHACQLIGWAYDGGYFTNAGIAERNT